MKTLPVEYLRERFNYDPETGSLIWRTSPAIRRLGKEAGTESGGHRKVFLLGKQYEVHRVIWAMVTGEWPSTQIDHKNLDGTDNRWGNLRLATKSQNAMNTRIRKDNKSGYKGVFWDKNLRKYRADIRLPTLRKHLGLFDDPKLAHEAYAKAVADNFGEFGRVS